MMLDVGCGNLPKGDVNCDLYTARSAHRLGQLLCTGAAENFVQCDANHLPFRDGVFNQVFSGQVIEHVSDPYGMLREMKRVCRGKIIVETVHQLGENLTLNPKRRRWIRQHHINKFTFQSFQQVSQSLGLTYIRGYVINRWLVKIPYSIGVELAV